MKGNVYSSLSNLILGFHGCDVKTYNKVIYKHQHLKPSKNKYDWLGHGIYFWENSYERALDWAKHKYKKKAKVIGAVIDLGLCLNLTDYRSAHILKNGYKLLKAKYDIIGLELPKNIRGKSKTDVLLRNLDCAVIEYIHYMKSLKGEKYDSVRGVFTEGGSVFPNSCIQEKTHIQIAILNRSCIKGYFDPIVK